MKEKSGREVNEGKKELTSVNDTIRRKGYGQVS